jgi:hypothetical protein
MMVKQKQLNAGDFPLGSTQSRAVARAMSEAKKRVPHIIHVTYYGRDPSLRRRELVSSFTDEAGRLWEVWKVSFQGVRYLYQRQVKILDKAEAIANK